MIAGCFDNSSSDRATAENDSETKSYTSQDSGSGGSSIGMVYAPGGLGDHSFNDMAHRGIQSAGLEYDTSFQYEEPDDVEEASMAQKRLARSSNPTYDLICCIGFQQTDPLKRNAESFPDQSFAVFDTVVDSPNVASYVFSANEGSFQIGHLAASLTTRSFSAGAGETNDGSTVVGYVGGQEIPPVQQFEAGYQAGVARASEDVDVLTEYVGSFSDLRGGRRAATKLYEQGADIIYHAAGGTGVGVFQAAQEQGRFAVGVDSDQSRSSPRYDDVILASMTKRLDTAVLHSVRGLVTDEFDGGEITSLGLAKDGVKVIYGTQLGSKIPRTVRTDLKNLKTKIATGEISVPASP